MARPNNISIIIGAIDKLSGPVQKMNATIERMRAPVDRINRATSKLGRASGMKQFNRSLRTAARNAANVRRKMGGISKIVGVGLAAPAAMLLAAVKSHSSAGDNIAKTAQRLGFSTDALQKHRYAAERSGVSAATFDMAIQRMGRRSAEAAKGMGEARGALKALGVSVTDTGGKMKGTEQIFLEVSDALGKVKDSNVRNALAMKMFDSEGVKLVQMTTNGATGIKALGKEAEKLGLIMSEKAAKDAERFEDSSLNLGSALVGLRNKIGANLTPTIIKLIDKLSKIAIELGPEVSKWAEGFAVNLPQHLETLKDGFNDLVRNIQPLVRVASWVSENFGLMNTAFAVIGTMIAGTLVSALYSLVTVFWALGAAMMATPIGWIIGAIAGVVAAGVVLYKNWDKITGVWNDLVKQFKSNPFKFVGDAIKGLANIVIKYNPISVLLKSVNWLIKKLTGFDVLKKLGEDVKQIQEMFASFGSWLAANNPFSGLLKDVNLLIKKLTGFDVLNKLGEGVKKIQEMFSSFGSWLASNNPFSLLSDSVNKILELFDKFNVLDGIKSNIQGLVPDWVGDSLGFGGGKLEAPLINQNSNKTEVYVKVDSEGRASVQNVKSSDNASIHLDTGKAMSTSYQSLR